MVERIFRIINIIALGWVLVVILSGAYVRLSHAGLGCPDWPGCYGHITVPSTAARIDRANANFPTRPVEPAKAWKEMGHRYLVGLLGVLILLLVATAFLAYKSDPPRAWWSLGLLLLVLFQAELGRLTVTEKLNPVVVTSHLLLGFATLCYLGLLHFRQRWRSTPARLSYRKSALLLWLAIFVLCAQIALGGWTSANYAAVVCYDFPSCYNKKWLPESNFKEAFTLSQPVGVNHEHGRMSPAARIAVHMSHRLGAVITLVLLVSAMVIIAWRAQSRRLKTALIISLGLLALQIGLGVSNVVFGLPLVVAVAHNGAAVLLLLSCLVLAMLLRKEPSYAKSAL